VKNYSPSPLSIALIKAKPPLLLRVVLPFVFLLFLMFTTESFAQETFVISGKVLDASTSQPIAFASVGIKGKPMGTVTNSEGKFDFILTMKAQTDTLVVTNLGYHAYRVAVKDIKNPKNFFITLQPRVYSISEVVITDEGTNAKEIVQKACDSVVKHTSNVPYISEGFYREYISENNHWARAIESALSVYSDGKQTIGDVFYPTRLNGIRFSKNYLSSFVNSENYNQIGLFMTTNMDVKRYTMTMNAMKFSVDSMIYLDDKLIWVISAVPEKTREKVYYRTEMRLDPNTQKVIKEKKKYTYRVEKNTDYYYTYRYYITDSDFDFVKVSYWDTAYRPIVKDELKTYTGLFISYTTTQRSLEFTRYNNLWYPKYISEHKQIDYYRKKDSALYISVVKQSDFLINAYQTELVTEIPKAKEIRMFRDIYNQGYAYDRIFWSRYNKIADDQLRKDVFTDLRLAELERDTSRYDLYLAMKDSLDKARNRMLNASTVGIVDTTGEVADEGVPDLFFKVQIAAGRNEVSVTDPQFKGLRGVERQFVDGYYKYTYGSESSLDDALQLQKQLQGMGFPGAFVVPFYKGERITLARGVEILNSH
jgi:hypothetical protein